MLRAVRKMLIRLLIVTLVVTGFQGVVLQQAGAADEYDDMRIKWFNYLTGADLYSLPVTDPDVQVRVDSIDTEVQDLWNTLNTSPGRTYLWSDVTAVNYPESRYIYENYNRIYALALAYRTKGAALEGDGTLLTDIKNALDWMYTNQYNETMTWQVNTHLWEISTPTTLCNIVILMYDQLSSTQRTNYMNAVDKFANDPTNYSTSTTISYGANRLWESLVIALRGVIGKNSSKLALVRDRLGDFEAKIYDNVKALNGWYRDGSFISHDRHPYNGSYGLGHFSTFIKIKYLLDGTSWEIDDPRGGNVLNWAFDGYVPLVDRGRLLDMVNGRTIAREASSDYSQGNALLDALLILVDASPPAESALLKRYMKEWMQENTYAPFYNKASLTSLIKAKAIVQDGGITPLRPELYRQYPSMDRAVQQRPDYTFGLAMYSDRVYDFEAIGTPANHNIENKRGWYTSSGMTYLYNDDLSQYNDNYWATVNMERMPGTTLDQDYARAEGVDSKLSTKSWVGGVELGDFYGVSGMELEGFGTTLTAKKSWFAFDDEIVALGSDIDSADSRTIETIIDNRKLNSTGNNALTVNGSAKSTSIPWSETMTGVNWIHLAGNVSGADTGYYFPGSATVKGLRESRTGSWKDVSDLASTTSYTNRFMNLWFDHGTNPSNAGYSYVLLPNRNATQVSSYAASPDISILENSEYVHAVEETGLDIVAANFWQDVKRTAGGITVDKKASVAMKETGTELEIAVSDPTQRNNGTIEVEINKTAAKVVTSDPAIEVLSLTPSIRLSVQVSGAMGATKRIKLDTASSTQPSVVTYTPSADASVHEDQASTNFGSSKSLSVREAIADQLDRKAVVKFDVTSIVSVTSAKLVVRSSTPSGKAAALTVMGAGDNWTEGAVTWSNAPVKESSVLDTIFVSGVEKDYELDVTDYVAAQAAGDNTVTLLLAGTDYDDENLLLLSREASYGGPRLIVQGTFSGATPSTPSAPAYEQIGSLALNDSFDSGTTGAAPSGWTLTQTGGSGVVNVPAGASGDKDYKLRSTSTGTFVQAEKSFTPVSGVVAAEFRVRADQTGEPITVSLLESTSAAPALEIVLEENGRIKSSEGPYSTYLQNYDAAQWYKIRVVLDTSTDQADVYVDDALKARRVPLIRAVSGIGAIRIGFRDPSVTVYLDDVKVGTLSSMASLPSAGDISGWDTRGDVPGVRYLINDGFNGAGTALPTGWTKTTSGGTVELVNTPSASNRSMKITDTSSTQATEAMHALADLSGKLVLDYNVMAGQTNVSVGAPYVSGYRRGNTAALNASVVVFSSDGNIKAYNGSTVTTLMPYSANTWYNIRLDMDTTTDKFDIYINGRLEASQFSFRDANIDFLKLIKFFFSTTATGSLYIDNLRVYTDAEKYFYNGVRPKPDVQLMMDDAVPAGTELEVKAMLRNPEDTIKPERVLMNYDPSRFEYVGISAGTLSGLSYTVQEIRSGYLSIGISGSSGATGDGTLFKVKFLPIVNSGEADFRIYSADLYESATGQLVQTETYRSTVRIDEPTYSVNDSFDSGSLPVGWSTVTAGGTVQVVNTPSSSDKSLRIQDTNNAQVTEATRAFTAITGTAVVEYSLMAAQTNVSLGGAYVLDGAGANAGIIVFSSDGNIKAYNGVTATTLRPYSANTWYDMRLVLNSTIDKYDVYVDGVKVADDFAYRSGVSSVEQLKFFFSTTATGTMYVNNVRVFGP
ncbi:polysaccharide lyase family 8 super-sandwich domain-containing protein [Paenibacillus koleovorans]|uniref:polysaccharide lyase family 8 super-sandwich domain-containing protein n=1 Tax=Paenibacillus koleovorans TaxID=121608 RepID=UPI000FD88E3A|nr:polysaccharide lyase family 8 super-sandwich domain-containing protein [Paenibacillus koleovorans]